MPINHSQTRIYIHMLSSWFKMLSGNSYWHQPQPLGPQFRPGALLGYFNDLTAKVVWPGKLDAHGIPLSISSGQKLYWPTTILQKTLGHWDLWLQSRKTAVWHWQAFLAGAQWALDNQDARGGWHHPIPLHPRALSQYSCMPQGQGVSVLCRAFAEDGDDRWLKAARHAIDAMLTPMNDGGTATFKDGSIVLEEFPSSDHKTVLNGWIFAIYGLYDYQLASEKADSAADGHLEATLHTLATRFADFDGGFWSLYDVSGAIASPFYHQLHIAQLAALSMTFPAYEDRFAFWRKRFEQQNQSRFKLLRAVAAKAGQKMRHPTLAVAAD